MNEPPPYSSYPLIDPTTHPPLTLTSSHINPFDTIYPGENGENDHYRRAMNDQNLPPVPTKPVWPGPSTGKSVGMCVYPSSYPYI